MIDILEMAKPEIKKRKLILDFIGKLRMLKRLGYNNDKIEDAIGQANLPLDIHLFITGNFSALMSGTHKIFGRK